MCFQTNSPRNNGQLFAEESGISGGGRDDQGELIDIEREFQGNNLRSVQRDTPVEQERCLSMDRLDIMLKCDG
jgi:hypothetical protein